MPKNTSRTTRTVSTTQPGALRFSTRNWIFLAAGFAALAAGFVTLASGSTVAAPLLLVLGYVVLIPLGIMS